MSRQLKTWKMSAVTGEYKKYAATKQTACSRFASATPCPYLCDRALIDAGTCTSPLVRLFSLPDACSARPNRTVPISAHTANSSSTKRKHVEMITSCRLGSSHSESQVICVCSTHLVEVGLVHTVDSGELQEVELKDGEPAVEESDVDAREADIIDIAEQ